MSFTTTPNHYSKLTATNYLERYNQLNADSLRSYVDRTVASFSDMNTNLRAKMKEKFPECMNFLSMEGRFTSNEKFPECSEIEFRNNIFEMIIESPLAFDINLIDPSAGAFQKDLFKYILASVCCAIIGKTYGLMNNWQDNKRLQETFKDKLAKTYVFDVIGEIDVNSATLTAGIFDRPKLDTIYQRYSKRFDAEPQHFNNCLLAFKAVYLDKNSNSVIEERNRLRSKVFNHVFIDSKLDHFLQDYIDLNIMKLMLSDLDEDNPIVPDEYDVNHLVRSKFKNPEGVLPVLNELFVQELKSQEHRKNKKKTYKELITELENDKMKLTALKITKKMFLKDIVNGLLETFFYSCFEKNDLKEYEKYQYRFYKKVYDIMNGDVQDYINSVLLKLNDLFDRIGSA